MGLQRRAALPRRGPVGAVQSASLGLGAAPELVSGWSAPASELTVLLTSAPFPPGPTVLPGAQGTLRLLPHLASPQSA